MRRHPMKPLAAASPGRQRGAVAIMVGLSLVVLVAMLALVMDLGQLYITRTELQNAADAGALAGAKELNGTAAGIDSAETLAISTAAENSVRFGASAGAVSIGRANVEYGPSPSGPWSDHAAAQAAPSGMSFIKVDTSGISQGTLGTWFMRVSNIDAMNTFGRAVAGTFSSDIAPLGVCAIDTTPTRTGPKGELMEFGFRRGMAYNIPGLNPLAGLPQDPMWINPVDTTGTGCDPSHASTSFTQPFVCAGRSASVTSTIQTVFINTGASAGLERALNSRFDDFTGNACDPATAPPDINIKQYSGTPTGGATGQPRDWMNPDPVQQTVSINTTSKQPEGYPGNPSLPGQFGVLWTFNPAVQNNSGVPGNAFTLDDWNAATPLYHAGLEADQTANGYPTPLPAGTPPYRQTSGKYFDAPSRPGLAERRLLRVVIVNCSSPPGGSGSCQTLPVIGIGKFFMQKEADLTGSPKKIEGEFAGVLLPGELQREIRLFR